MKTEGQKQSQKHERRLANKIGGSTTAASGAFWSRKGDARSEQYLIEHKYTAAKSYRLTKADLNKVLKEALMVGRIPLFCIHMDGYDLVVQFEDDFFEMAGIDPGDTP